MATKTAEHKNSVTIAPILQCATNAEKALSSLVVDWCFVTAKATRNRAAVPNTSIQ